MLAIVSSLNSVQWSDQCCSEEQNEIEKVQLFSVVEILMYNIACTNDQIQNDT